MPRTACDGCYRRKGRCLFDANEHQCRQCRLLSTSCSFERRVRRMGRPPMAKKVPYGSCGILSFGTDDTLPGQPATPMHSDFEGSARHCSRIESMVINGIGTIQNIRGFEYGGAGETDETDDAQQAGLTVAICERTDVDIDTSDVPSCLIPCLAVTSSSRLERTIRPSQICSHSWRPSTLYNCPVRNALW